MCVKYIYQRSSDEERWGGNPAIGAQVKHDYLTLLDPLKVFVEFDPQYEIFVAQCLQTGHLVTADDADKVKEMITELLEDEVSRAVETDDNDLLAHPAPLTLWAKWAMAERAHKPEARKIRVNGNSISKELRLLLGQAEVQAEIHIATGRTSRAAA